MILGESALKSGDSLTRCKGLETTAIEMHDSDYSEAIVIKRVRPWRFTSKSTDCPFFKPETIRS